ncbi:protein LYK5-like [Zingiber officinale]|uniref:Protein kinase domain-containing protein n=1 Tax=Zingiber officinale TaxID=94328 RepID=A0A8J5FWQ9_ZINOF|nr:protein LYK5-like [Zingiber officinale]KAG6494310.1 hypothetical protein ZIOFF_049334 [Zingiber officinale]
MAILFLILLLFSSSCFCHAQQLYINNKQNACSDNSSSTLGYVCNGPQSCSSFLTFRSTPVYRNPVLIAFLLNASASNISSINGVNDVSTFPDDQIVLVPLPCSCSGGFYQHNASYSVVRQDTYLIIANNTYQGLTTCQALDAQNPNNARNLSVDLQLNVPVRCACPSPAQSRSGIRYLLNYLVTWGDDIPTIATRFRADEQAVRDANSLSADAVIYPFTTLLVPLTSEPTRDEIVTPLPPSQPADSPPAGSTPGSGSSSSNKGVFIGVGSGVGLLALFCAGGLIWFLCRRRRRRGPVTVPDLPTKKTPQSSAEYSELSEKGHQATNPSLISVEIIRGALESLRAYDFRELEDATGGFDGEHRIMGSVYRGVINGDAAAIKRLKGDVSKEINILKQINHSNVIRLSGYCLHGGDTFLVYEFAENGSLADWLLKNGLGWKQRVQISVDVAQGLNYLHDYANPPYVHQNLKSSNVLLDGELRAKVGGFGLARPVEDGETPQLTRHVVGTQGYMSPEYLEHGLITPKLDVFAFGVVMLQLLSGREATFPKEEEDGDGGKKGGEAMLWAAIGAVMTGEDARGKLVAFMDPWLRRDYPLDLAYEMAKLANRCVAREPVARPNMAEVLVALTAIYNSTLDWDCSDAANSSSMILAR